MHGDKRWAARQKPDYGKTIVVGTRDRASNHVTAEVVPDTTRLTLSNSGRCDRMPVDEARGEAQRLLGKVAMGEDPAEERTRSRRIPSLKTAFEDYMKANPKGKPSTDERYRHHIERTLADWLARPLDTITRADVEERFNRMTELHGAASANQCLSLLRSVYRRPCVDFEGLDNPVDLWLAGGGRFHNKLRRKIPPPAEILPRWRAGIEAVVSNPALRDIFWFGMYVGMRLGEVLPLRWDRVDREALVFRVDETKTGAPLELPITRQLAAILERRWTAGGHLPDGWVFPSVTSRTGQFVKLSALSSCLTISTANSLILFSV